MSDEDKLIPKAEFDRRIAALKERETALLGEISTLKGRVGELEPIAARVNEAEAEVTQMRQRTERDATWREVGDLDPALRARLERLYDLDPPTSEDGQPVDFATWINDRSDPVLGALLPPAPSGEDGGASEQGVQPAPAGQPAPQPQQPRGTRAAPAGNPAPQARMTPEQAMGQFRGLLAAGKMEEAKAFREEHLT